LIRPFKIIWGVLILAPLSLWAILNWWHTAVDVSRFYVNFPVWDYLDLEDHHLRYKAVDLSVFWEQHNEHRIVFPELIFAADQLWLHGQMVLPLVASFCFYFGIGLIIAFALSKDRSVSFVLRCGAALLAAILLAWTGAAHPLATPFLLQWTLSQFTAILAFAFLAKVSLDSRLVWLLAMLTSAIVSTFSSANGLLLWTPLIFFAACLRLGWRRISFITAIGALSSALYFVGYKSPEPIHWKPLFAHPLYLIEFLGAYVSMPFALLRPEPMLGVRVGLWSFVALAIALFLAWRNKVLKNYTAIVLFGYMTFVLGSALLTALGRMNPDDPAFQSAKAVRYMTMPLSYWAVLAAIVVWILARVPSVGMILAATFICITSLVLFRMSHKRGFSDFAYSMNQNYANQQWAAMAVESGVLEPNTNLILFPGNPTFMRVVSFMRREKLALFAQPESSWVGRDAKEIFPIQPGPLAAGGIVASKKLETAVTVAGWARKQSAHLELVLIDENNRIVGLGERLPAGLPQCFENLRTGPDQQWTGFVNLAYGSHSATPYIVSPDLKTLRPLPAELKIDR
jgi:hypothetical protein